MKMQRYCYFVMLLCYVGVAYRFKGYRVRFRVRLSYTYMQNYVHCSSPLGGSQLVSKSSHCNSLLLGLVSALGLRQGLD